MAWLIQGTLPKTVETLDSVLAFCMALLKVLQKPHVQVWRAISADTLLGELTRIGEKPSSSPKEPKIPPYQPNLYYIQPLIVIESSHQNYRENLCLSIM